VEEVAMKKKIMGLQDEKIRNLRWRWRWMREWHEVEDSETN
jgi:hypothetical protein